MYFSVRIIEMHVQCCEIKILKNFYANRFTYKIITYKKESYLLSRYDNKFYLLYRYYIKVLYIY